MKRSLVRLSPAFVLAPLVAISALGAARMEFGEAKSEAIEVFRSGLYWFEALAGDRVCVGMVVESGYNNGKGFVPELAIQNANGKDLARTNTTSRFVKLEPFECQYTGKYLIEVSDGNQRLHAGSYRVALQRRNRFTDAPVLTPARVVSSTNATIFKWSVYTFEAAAGDQVAVGMVVDHGWDANRGFLPALAVDGPDGTHLAALTSTNRFALIEGLVCPSAGVYLVRAFDGNDGLHTGGFRVALQRRGDTSGAGVLPLVDAGHTVSGAIGGPFERDSYTFDANVGDRVSLGILVDDGWNGGAGFGAGVALLGPDGSQVLSLATTNDFAYIADINCPALGTYTVCVFDGNEGFHAGNYRLDLQLRFPGVPTILEQPQDQQVNFGAEVAFSVRVYSTVPMLYSWLLDGKALQTRDLLGGEKSIVYSIPAVEPKDAGTYTLTVRNERGAVTSEPAKLDATPCVVPEVKGPMQLLTVDAGSTVTLSATVAGSRPMSVRWRWNNTELVESDRIAGVTSTNLTISGVQLGDRGAYEVVASNFCGSATGVVSTLTIWAAPKIEGQPVYKTLTLGERVSFTATVAGYPPPTYQWQLNGEDIPGAIDASYTIENAQWEHAGVYSLKVSNVAGSETNVVGSLSFLALEMYAGLTVVGPIGASYDIWCATSLDTNNWQLLTNFALPSSPYRFIDWDSPAWPKRFYRAEMKP